MPVLTLPASASNLTVRAKALVFDDARSRELLSRIEQVAPSDATILLSGETGTGKEIVARHIHQLSRRSTGAFVAVNCGAFSENLVESELFGHEKGSFTGALSTKAGWFEVASGGTLFLDEIGDLPLSVQVKLLRVLQEGEVVRVGSRHSIAVNVRLIAATNVDLREAMAAGHFREDLYYRLNVVSVNLPPLRERPGDIAPLARYFVDLYRRKLGIDAVELSGSAVEGLLQHSWPGNIRELENAVHHALLVCKNGRIESEDLRLAPPPALTHVPQASSMARPPDHQERPREIDSFDALERLFTRLFESREPALYERVDRALMGAAFRYCERNQLQTARLLGISRNVVRARLIQYGELSGTLRSAASSRLPTWSPPPTFKLRLGYQKFGQLLLVKTLGQLDRALAARGVEVEWSQFPGGLQLVEALHAGDLDLGVVGECPPVFAQAADAPIVYVAAEASAPEAEAILVHEDSPIARVTDLRGRRIALNRGANVHYLLIRALEEAGLTYDDVEAVFLAPDEAERAFCRREVDGWAIWDPWLTSARARTRARVLRDGRGLTSNTSYYVARREFAQRQPELIDQILQEVERASRYARANPATAVDMLSRESGMQREALERWLHGVAGTSRIGSAEVRAQQQIADRLFSLKLLPQAVRVADAQWLGRAAI